MTGTGSKLEAFLYSIAYTVLSVNQLINDVVNAGKIVTDIANNVVGQIDALFSGDLLRANELQNDLSFLYNDAANFLAELFSEDNSKLIEDGAREIAGRFVSKFTEGVSNSAEVRESFETLATESTESLQSALDGLSTPLTETNNLLAGVGDSADTAAGKVTKLSTAVKTAMQDFRAFEQASYGQEEFLSNAGQRGSRVEEIFQARLNEAVQGWRQLEQQLVNQQAAIRDRAKAAYDAAYEGWRESEQQLVRNQSAVDERTQAAYDEAVSGWRELEQQLVRNQAAILEAAKSAYDEAVDAWRDSEVALVNRQAAIEEAQQRAYDTAVSAWRDSERDLVNHLQASIDKMIADADAMAEANRQGFGALPDTSQEGTPEFDSIKKSALELGEKVLPGLSNVLSAFATGPVAGITAIFTELFSRSESFGVLLERVNEFLQPFVDILGQLLEAIAPAIEVFLALVETSLAPITFLLRDVIAPVLKAVASIIAFVWNAIADAVRIITFGLVKLPKIDPNGGMNSDAETGRDEDKRKQAEDEVKRAKEEAERKRKEVIQEQRDREQRRFDYRLQGNSLDQRDLELKRQLGGLNLSDYLKQLGSLKVTEAALQRDQAVSDLQFKLALGEIDQAEFDRLREQLDREFGIISEEIAQELQAAFVDAATFDELIQKAKELRQQLSLAPDSKLQDFLDEVDQKIREILGITVSDFESALGEALGNSKSYEEFLKNWESGLASTTESALRQAFLKSAYTQALLQTVSDLFSQALADQRIDPVELAAIQAAYDQISRNVGLYYDLLEQLGLSAGEFGETLDETNKQLQEVNETLNIPTGFKIDLERFTAGTARSAVNATANVAAMNLEQVNITIEGDMYGFDDFQSKVGEANTRLSRNVNLAKFGRR